MTVVNGAEHKLTPRERKQLQAAASGTPFDPYERLFPSFSGGKVFDYANDTARDLKEMLSRDGNARKVEQVLTLPIRSAAWEIRAAPGGDAEYKYIRAQFDARLDKVIDQMTTAIVFRKAFFELTYGVDGDTVTVESIDLRPATSCEAGYEPKTGDPRGFRQRVGNPGGLIAWSDMTSGDTPGYVEIEPERAFVFVHGAYREPIEGVSDLDVTLWCWETRQKIYFLWFQFLEQQSLPKTVVYGDAVTGEKNADAVAEANASAVIRLDPPSGEFPRAFDVIESSGAGAGQFLEAIRYLESQMSASVLAGFTDLTSLANGRTSGSGSYALSADQSEFFLAARQAVADEIAEAVTRDLFARMCVWQFGPDCKPPTLEIGPLSKRDKERSLSMLNSLLTADHFNSPPGLIDLLIKSTSGYLGLPVDQVAKLVDDHPAQEPPSVAGKGGPGGPQANDAELGTDEPTPVGQAEFDPKSTFQQLAGLAHEVDEYTARTQAGEKPADVVASWQGKKRRTRRRRG